MVLFYCYSFDFWYVNVGVWTTEIVEQLNWWEKCFSTEYSNYTTKIQWINSRKIDNSMILTFLSRAHYSRFTSAHTTHDTVWWVFIFHTAPRTLVRRTRLICDWTVVKLKPQNYPFFNQIWTCAEIFIWTCVIDLWTCAAVPSRTVVTGLVWGMAFLMLYFVCHNKITNSFRMPSIICLRQ